MYVCERVRVDYRWLGEHPYFHNSLLRWEIVGPVGFPAARGQGCFTLFDIYPQGDAEVSKRAQRQRIRPHEILDMNRINKICITQINIPNHLCSHIFNSRI